MSDSHDATVYLQLQADTYTYAGGTKVRGLRATTLTQKRPHQLKPGAVLVKLIVRVPDAAFLPLQPEAVVVIPESMTVHALEVEAVDVEEYA